MATEAELQIVRDYVNAAIAAYPDNWVNVVTQRMDELGVSPSILQQAFPDVDLGTIQAGYNQARPTGLYSTTEEKASATAQQFFDFLQAGDRANALRVLNEAQGLYPGVDLADVAAQNVASALGAGMRDIIGGADSTVTADELRAYLARTDTGADTGAGAGTDNISTRTEGREELTGGAKLDSAGNVRTETTIPGVPGYTEQRPSGLSFFPVQRGLGSLRGPAYMPGLLQGSEGFGGTGLSRQQVLEGINPYARAIEGGMNTEQAIQNYIRDVMVPQGLSPAEVAAASPTLSLGATQQAYNQFAPRGVFSTAAPPSPVLPEDFVLQTGAYTLPAIASNIALPEQVEETTSGGTRLDQLINPIFQVGPGHPLYGSSSGFLRDQGKIDLSNNPIIGYTGTGEAIYAPPSTSEPGRSGGVVKENQIVKMAEGGEAMGKLSPAEAGSKFDISEFIDDEGRLVGGYSRPIRDQYGVITGYDYRPYERDVVFNPRLAEAEARGMSDEEREAARRGLIVRQGLTGVDPYAGGLAGIQAREALMRNRPRYYSYAKGGLADVAQDLASKGRFGDTMVAHISPQEAGLLKALGGAGTINPETGLPEFFSLFPKKGIKLNLGPLGNIKIGAKSSNFIQAAIANALGVPPPVYGAFRGAVTGNLMEGIQAGITAYSMQAMADAFGPEFMKSTQVAAPISEAAGAVAPEASGQVLSQQVPIESGVGFENAMSGAELEPFMQGEVPTTTTFDSSKLLPVSQQPPAYGSMPGTTAGTEVAKQGYLDRTLPASVKEYIPQPILDASGTQLAVGATLGSSLLAGQQTPSVPPGITKEEEEKYRRLYEQTLGRVRTAKQGGLMSLAKGGMTYMEAGGTTGPTGEPRDVTGTGDGMSDSVPANIEGVQEARLADGEFVIPADVVADIGNGSSDAGSKKLYDMMDRIRMARHGTKEQPPEIKAERLMPA